MLRQLVDVGAYGEVKHVDKLDIELGLILTTMLQLGVYLARLAPDGELRDSLPKSCTILVVSANRHAAKLLEDMGFRILLRPAPHESQGSEDKDDNLAQANLSIYRLDIGNPNNDKATELRHLMADLLDVMAAKIEPPNEHGIAAE